MNTNSPYAQTVISEMMENEMSYEDAEKYVAEASYEQLNMEHPALTRSFVTAVEAFGYYFGLEDEDISKLINEMLGKTEPLTISTMMKNAYEMLDPNAQSREAAIVFILRLQEYTTNGSLITVIVFLKIELRKEDNINIYHWS